MKMSKQILIKNIGTKDYALFFQELSDVIGEHCYSFEIDDEFSGQVVPAGGRSGCPCLYTKPCHRQCTCVTPSLSGGCRRCASYGSKKQQKEAAEYLAKIIDNSQQV